MGTSFSSTSDEPLKIKIGNDDDDNTRKSQRPNQVKTSKYTLVTFIPLNIFQQFRRLIYFYYIIIAIISFILPNTISPTNALIPLLVPALITALKEGLEDIVRHKNDKILNTSKISIIRNGSEQEVNCELISPGDLVVVNRDTDVPCDLVLLRSSDVHGKCYLTSTNLDGESNLKTMLVPHVMCTEYQRSDLALLGNIVCEKPKSELYNFNGFIELSNNAGVLPLNVENVLLRGCRIKNTERVIGCAIYTGMSTKLQLNSCYTNNKKASSEHLINRFFLAVVVMMFILIFIMFGIERGLENKMWPEMAYLGPDTKMNTPLVIFEDFLIYLILFNYMVPISMYINIEVYRAYGALFMSQDHELYDPETDQPCRVQASNLNEDLGQINILFSDKTGTLTKNEMKFMECSIDGRKLRFHENKLLDPETAEIFHLEDLTVEQLELFKALTVCHTVQVLKDNPSISNSIKSNGQLTYPIYQASSPDEKALLEGCAKLGLIYDGDVNNSLMSSRQLFANGAKVRQRRFQRLHVLEFSSDRKRMSIIVRDVNGIIWLYSKGAEDSIFPLCLEDYASLIVKTNEHITDFARNGLRTLVVGKRKLSNKDFDAFMAANNVANSALENRQQLVAESYAMIEKDLQLIGATAVEDVLQDNLNETLVALQVAGLKIWVLTGDKVETALNVGLSCHHIPPKAIIHTIVNVKEGVEMSERLRACADNFRNNNCTVDQALLIDGTSLNIALISAREEFRDIALQCKAVLCCRLTPLQKSEVVVLIKETDKYLTAAIGDGDNDVSMIQMAHVGIGIMGREGKQAARCADFAIAKFCMLQRLLLVHGHYNSTRLWFLVLFYIYKNTVMFGCMVLYQFFDIFSSTTVYANFYLIMFDTLYLSFSFTFVAFTEKPYSEDKLLKNPSLYKSIANNCNASWWIFGSWMGYAVLHTCIIFFFAYFTIAPNNVVLSGGQTADYLIFGTMLVQAVVIVCHLKLILEARCINIIGIIFISVAIYIGLILSTYLDNIVGANDLYGVYSMFLSSLPMWLFIIITPITCLVTDYTVKAVQEVISQKRDNFGNPQA